MKRALRLDEIGYWSELKLDIIRKYASAYSTVLSKDPFIKRYMYIDGFAGAGTHISKSTRKAVAGSPVNALQIVPRFSALHFIDLDGVRVKELQRLAEGDRRVKVHLRDCNRVLLSEVFPLCRYRDYRRALCVLDPYGLNVDFAVLKTAGRMKSVEVFYNFMIMDANMNVFMRDPDRVTPEQAARMDRVWGDRSWRDAAYRRTSDLLGERQEKVTNAEIARAFQERLHKAAGFAYVPDPIPMRNSRGAVVYYLYFASPNDKGAKIVSQIFDKYPGQGGCVMATKSRIEWTEATWNPVTGCDKVSPGCAHCYAERMAKRLQAMGQRNYAAGFAVRTHSHMLEHPLRWKRPLRIFVNSMSDLFHDAVPDQFVRRVFDVMTKADWHEYQVLTKRSRRLALLDAELPWRPHIWMGVSVENRRHVCRIDDLRSCRAHVKFLSLEPLLGPMPDLDLSGIHWVIVGGESGPGARPMRPEWVVDIQEQCRRAGVNFFFKQWGGVFKKKSGRELNGRTWDEIPESSRIVALQSVEV